MELSRQLYEMELDHDDFWPARSYRRFHSSSYLFLHNLIEGGSVPHICIQIMNLRYSLFRHTSRDNAVLESSAFDFNRRYKT